MFRDAKTARYEQEDEKKKEPPETARAAPGILELHLLADLLARVPTAIPAALAAAGEARFYPTFLEYLMRSLEEFVNPPRLRLWKRLAANEHISLLQDWRQRVCEILLTTRSWELSGPAQPPQSSDGGQADGPAAEEGFTASMLGVGELRAGAAKVKKSRAPRTMSSRKSAWGRRSGSASTIFSPRNGRRWIASGVRSGESC